MSTAAAVDEYEFSPPSPVAAAPVPVDTKNNERLDAIRKRYQGKGASTVGINFPMSKAMLNKCISKGKIKKLLARSCIARLKENEKGRDLIRSMITAGTKTILYAAVQHMLLRRMKTVTSETVKHAARFLVNRVY